MEKNKLNKEPGGFELINPDAAGIDISSREHYVAVPKDRDKDSVKKFGTFTEDLHKIALWLKACRIKTVAMESTAVYWVQLFLVLEEYGFEVFLVNARHVKNVSGRKTDVKDCQWIQQLHSYGLLRNSFQPENQIRELRNYVRQRKKLIEDKSRYVQLQQKALEQMNIKLHIVISDINGKTGKAMINKILEGERRPDELAKYTHPRIKATREVIIKSLRGNWRDDQIFILKQAFESGAFIDQQIIELDKQIEKVITAISEKFGKPEHKDTNQKESKSSYKNRLNFDSKKYLKCLYGVDITKMEGIDEISGLSLLAEVGVDIKSKFPTEKQFQAWLNVVPNNKITGGKLKSSRVMKKKNKAGQIFRNAAYTLFNSKGYFGQYLRSRKAKDGTPQAIVATASKMARVFYKMVTEKIEFNSGILYLSNEMYLRKKLAKMKSTIENIESVINANTVNYAFS
ncbi:MAG TPA: IS110 family transposase [Chitinophagaceae bacterium]|nr:IS110 family transposase [Chitinophagaceae bacterium]